MKIFQMSITGILLMVYLSAGAQTKFEKKQVVQSFTGPAGLFAGDINGDRIPDIAAGSGTFGLFVITNDLKGSGKWNVIKADDKFGACIAVFIIDMDKDNLNDIVAGSWDTGEIAWYRNTGDPSVWIKNTIARNFTQAHEVFVTDMDRDGDNDVLGAGAGNNQIAWWRNDGGNPGVWTPQVLSNHFMGARSVAAADLDLDGDVDVAGASLNGNEVTVWMNNGGNPFTWTEVTLTATFTGSHRVQIADMNNDHLPDILATAYSVNTIAWWANPGAIQGNWNRNIVDNALPGAVIGTAVDLDLDGDPDVVGTGQPGNRVAWYENTGEPQRPWKKNEVESSFGGPWPLCIADFDADGDPDFAVGGNSANEIRWYENIQEGRITRLLNTSTGQYPVRIFLPPGLTEKTKAYIALPYSGDSLASGRLRDMLIGLSESAGGVVFVPEYPNQGPPFFNPSDEELLNKILEESADWFPVNQDSVYLIGFESNGLETVRSGMLHPDKWLGIIPFNPLLPELPLNQFQDYPDIPVCLCSGTLHADRGNHSDLVNRINERFGKALLVNLDNTAGEILVDDFTDRLVDCKTFIDTVRGSASATGKLMVVKPVRIYPNPADESLFIEIPFEGQTSAILEIRSATGIPVLAQKIEPGLTHLDLNPLNLAAGLYFLTVRQENHLWRDKLFLNRH